jgi:hypothetical protein
LLGLKCYSHRILASLLVYLILKRLSQPFQGPDIFAPWPGPRLNGPSRAGPYLLFGGLGRALPIFGPGRPKSPSASTYISTYFRNYLCKLLYRHTGQKNKARPAKRLISGVHICRKRVVLAFCSYKARKLLRIYWKKGLYISMYISKKS